MRFLRQNTATIVTVGPFYDKTTGVDIETGLTITNERISATVDLNDGSAPTLVLDNVTGATSGTSNDLNYITNCDAGLMQLELAAADVNYVGRFFLTITDAANHCPVFHEFTILPAQVYDSLILGTDLLDSNATQFAGQTITAAAGVTLPTSVASPTNITAGTITTVTTLTNLPAIPANWLTAAGIADGALTAAKFAAGALDAVWSTATRTLTAATNLTTDIAAAVWDRLTSALTTVGSIGEWVLAKLNVVLSTRAATGEAETARALLATLIGGAFDENVGVELSHVASKQFTIPASSGMASVNDLQPDTLTAITVEFTGTLVDPVNGLITFRADERGNPHASIEMGTWNPTAGWEGNVAWVAALTNGLWTMAIFPPAIATAGTLTLTGATSGGDVVVYRTILAAGTSVGFYLLADGGHASTYGGRLGTQLIATEPTPSAIYNQTTAQAQRDTGKLAPSAGAPAAGSIDEHLDTIEASGGGAGTGASSVTITVNDALGNPVADCEAWITSDIAGAVVVAGPLVTDDNGAVVFLLDVGVTYYLWRRKAGWNFTNPATFVAVAD